MNLYSDPRRECFLRQFPTHQRSDVANAFLRCHNENKTATYAELCRAVWLSFYERNQTQIVEALTRIERTSPSVALDYASWVREWAALPTGARECLKRGAHA